MIKKYSIFILTKRLLSKAKPIWKELVISCLASFFGHLGQMGFMGFGALWLLSVAKMISFHALYPWLMILSAIFIAIGRYIEGIFSHIGAYAILAQLRIEFFTSIEKRSPAIFVQEEMGNLMNLAMGDIETLEYFYAHTIGPMMTVILLPIISLAIAYHYSALWMWVLLPVYIMVIVVIPSVSLRYGKRIGLRLRRSLGRLKALILETVYGLKDLQIYHFQGKRLTMIQQENEEVNAGQHVLTLYKQALNSIPNFFVYLARVLVIYVAAYLAGIGKADPVGTIVVSFVTSASFSSSFSLTFILTQLIQAYAAASRLFQLEDGPLFVQEKKDSEPLSSISTIVFQDVHFTYPKVQEEILSGMNLMIQSGETIGIIGESGSGKSTLLRLLMRFYDVQSGSILINGKDIRNYSLQSLHDRMSLLEQDSYLFDQSIRDNLLMAKKDASTEEIEACLKEAGIDTFVHRLPEGLDTLMGEMNDRVSGGERQRLSLARAILKDPDILILDEPSANLDTIHELELLQTIEKAYQHKMVIIISHRYSTLVHCDRIYEMKNQRLELRTTLK